MMSATAHQPIDTRSRQIPCYGGRWRGAPQQIHWPSVLSTVAGTIMCVVQGTCTLSFGIAVVRG